MMKMRMTIFLAALAGAALTVAGCGGASGTLADDSGAPATDSGTGGDTAVTDSGKTDSGGDTSSGDTGSGDTGSGDTGSGDTGTTDTGADTGPIIPEGGVASAPVAGGAIATNSKYILITKTVQGGSNGPMTNSKYDLHGGTVTVIPK